jgi:hypothetical protein
MKISFILTFLLLSGLTAFPQEVRTADALSPEDLDAHKYVFEAQAAAGQVVVFRRERYEDGKLVERYDTISNQRGKKQVREVLLLNLATLTGGHSQGYTLKSPGSVGNIDTANLQMADCSSNPPTVTLVFHDIPGHEPAERKFVFTIFTESYEAAKRRFPNLRDDTDSSSSWTAAFFDESIKK